MAAPPPDTLGPRSALLVLLVAAAGQQAAADAGRELHMNPRMRNWLPHHPRVGFTHGGGGLRSVVDGIAFTRVLTPVLNDVSTPPPPHTAT